MEIRYITGLSAQIGIENERITLAEKTGLAELIELLMERSIRHRKVFENYKALRAYSNGQILESDAILSETDIVTFFSPISGG